jgi:recombination protein RecA
MSDDKSVQSALDVINKKYGDGTIIDYGKAKLIPGIETITTGLPSLDVILGGGVPKGRIMEVFGPNASGKTTMAIHMLSKCQKAGKRVAYIDVENAFDPAYATKLGLDVKNLILNQPDSGEQALDIVEKLCQTGQFSAIVIDSVAQLVPMAVSAKEIDGSVNIATTARLLSQTLPRLSNAASRGGTVLIFINQIRENVGQLWGNPEVTPGGHALKFAASIRLEVRSGSKAEERSGKEGVEVKITVKKNKIAPPFRTTSLFLVYGEGFDEVTDLLEIALQLGIIHKAGAWFTYKDFKENGWVKFIEGIKLKPEYLEDIKTIIADSTTIK